MFPAIGRAFTTGKQGLQQGLPVPRLPWQLELRQHPQQKQQHQQRIQPHRRQNNQHQLQRQPHQRPRHQHPHTSSWTRPSEMAGSRPCWLLGLCLWTGFDMSLRTRRSCAGTVRGFRWAAVLGSRHILITVSEHLKKPKRIFVTDQGRRTTDDGPRTTKHEGRRIFYVCVCVMCVCV